MQNHFRIEEHSVGRIVHCLTDLTEDVFPELLVLLNGLDKSSVIILDFEEKMSDDFKLFRAITPFGLQLKKQGRRLYVIRANAGFEAVVFESGMNEILAVFPVFADAYKYLLGRSNKSAREIEKTDVVFLNSFIDATIKILQIQCNVTIVAKPACIKGAIPDMTYDIAGVIGLVSKAFRGSISICYPKQTFLALIGSMLGESYTDITKDLEDGAAELLNMIFGQAKADLNEKKYEIEKAIPTVIRGEALRMNHLASTPTLVIPFESPVGLLRIEINIETRELRKAA